MLTRNNLAGLVNVFFKVSLADEGQDVVHRARQPMGERVHESFNGKLRDELLNGEIFYSLIEAQVLARQWRHEYNWRRPHSALGYRPPAPYALETAPVSAA